MATFDARSAGYAATPLRRSMYDKPRKTTIKLRVTD